MRPYIALTNTKLLFGMVQKRLRCAVFLFCRKHVYLQTESKLHCRILAIKQRLCDDGNTSNNNTTNNREFLVCLNRLFCSGIICLVVILCLQFSFLITFCPEVYKRKAGWFFHNNQLHCRVILRSICLSDHWKKLKIAWTQWRPNI